MRQLLARGGECLCTRNVHLDRQACIHLLKVVTTRAIESVSDRIKISSRQVSHERA